MPKSHTVATGEGLSSIAEQYGFFLETLWDDPKNAALKEERRNPNALEPGDIVHIPDPRPKEAEGATGANHQFVRKGVPAKFHLKVVVGQSARANQPYELEVDGKVLKGTTNDQGLLSESIPPSAAKGLLTIGPDNLQIEIDFGQLGPIAELRGVQQRLSNLGFLCETDGEPDESTEAAIKAFQAKFDLEPTGELDDDTRYAIEAAHDDDSEDLTGE